MPRATRTKTQYPGVFKRLINTHGGAKGEVVHDVSYRDATGKPRWVNGLRLSARAAADHRRELLNDARNGVPSDGRTVTVGKFGSESWVPHLRNKAADRKLRSSTLKQYERDFRNHIEPRLGGKPLAHVTIDDIEALGVAIISAGSSPDTARRAQVTAGYLLKHARKRRLINYNPADDAEKQTSRRREPSLPTLGDVYRVADAAADQASHATLGDEHRKTILFAAFAGLRASELFGLRWANVTLDEGVEAVRVVEQFYKGELVPHAKTSAGNREVPLSDDAARVLRAQSLSQQVNGRANTHGLVFPAPEGGYWRDSNFNRRVWKPARIAARLPELLFHTLRYFYISTIRTLDLPLAVSEQLVGHEDERTHRGYTRPTADGEALARKRLAGAFARPEAS